VSKVIPLVPRAKADAEGNLASFIDRARNELTVFGEDLDFDADRWDLTAYYLSQGDRAAKTAAIWLNFTQRQKDGGHPFSSPVRDFAKAFVRTALASKSSSNTKLAITSFRALDAAIRDLGISSLADCDANTFNRASEILRANTRKGENASTGAALGVIARYMDEHGLVYAPLHNWKYIATRRGRAGRVGAEFEQRRQEKLPSQESLDGLAQAFHLATEPRDILVASIAAIFCAAPERINEVMALPAGCEIERQGDDGKSYLGLRWAGSKGAADHIKWVLPGMADVIRSALAKIRQITEPAREMAGWYETHPDKLYLPPHLEHLRGRPLLTLEEVGELAGLSADKHVARDWMKRKGIPFASMPLKHPIQGDIQIQAAKFEDIERHILGTLPKGFPIHDERTGLKYSDALLVIPRGLFSNRANNIGERCMFEYVKYHHIGCAFGGNGERGSVSVFKRVGIDPDGKLRIRSHQFRHWLNTLAQGASLSQVDIAKWSGRANVYQNTAYDHVSSEENVAQIREAIGDHAKAIGPLAEIPKNLPVSRAEFAAMTVPTAHVTVYGFCIHDYTTAPCEMFRQCLDCREHVCVKGIPDKTERVRQTLAAARVKLEKAIRAVADEVFGAVEWAETHQATVDRLENLLAILEDPTIADGAIVQLTTTNTHSLSEGAVLDRLRLDGPPTVALPPASRNKALT
jgi:hypothetical protein